MVSYPDDTNSTSTLSAPFRQSRPPTRSQTRAPSRTPSASSASRSSTTLRPSRHNQRYSKSHAGVTSTSSSSSYVPINEFPVFERTGDVEIVLISGRQEARYVLHKLYLAQCSGWFEDVLGLGESHGIPFSESVSMNAKSHRLASHRVRFELDSTRAGESLPMLILKPIPSGTKEGYSPGPPPLRPKPPAPSAGFFRSMSTFSSLHISQAQTDPTNDVLRIYDNLFRIFYNHEPLLDKTNTAVAYAECKALLQLASSYEALDIIGSRIDHHLLRFGSRLWKQIAKYPPSYLKLGYLARSRVIFSEALIHVVGQWPASESALRGQVPPDVLDLVEDKVDQVDDLRRRIESRLWRLTLTTTRGERVAPSVSWLDWLVISLWRQWYAENTTPALQGILKAPHVRSSSTMRDLANRPPPSRTISSSLSPINLARVYKLLGTGGQAYLTHDDVKRFLKLSPEIYSRDNLRRAERRLDELKNLARDAVQPLTRNFLELESQRDGAVPYLTCVRISESEWPWDG